MLNAQVRLCCFASWLHYRPWHQFLQLVSSLPENHTQKRCFRQLHIDPGSTFGTLLGYWVMSMEGLP